MNQFNHAPVIDQQRSYLQELRNRQIHDLSSFYPEMQLIQNTPQKTEYRVPIQIAVSRTPLFVRIDVLPNFPQQPPIIQVLARVTHPDIHPQRKTYQGKVLQEWGLHSSLVNLIRAIQSDFNRSPPIPEGIQQQQQQNPQQWNIHQQALPNQPLNQDQAKDNFANSMSSQDALKLQKLSSLNKIEDKLKEMVQPLDVDKLMTLINNLNYEELEEMKENEQYLRDFILEREEMQKFQRDCDKIADQANILASENIQKFEEIQKLMEENNKLTQSYEKEKLNLERSQRSLEAMKQKYQPHTIVQVLSVDSNNYHKESEKQRKQFNQGQMSVEQFISSYLESRTQHYEIELIKAKVKSQPSF